MRFFEIGERGDVDLGIFVELLQLLAVGRVDRHDRLFVAADVGNGVEILVIEGEELRTELFAEVGREHFLERRLFIRAGEQAGVDPVGLGRGADDAGVVGDPAIDFARILRHQFHFARRYVETEGIENFRITLVQRDEDIGLGDVGEVVDDLAPHFRERGHVLHLAALQVDALEVEILIAFIVHSVDEEVVPFPAVVANVAILFARDALRLAALDRTHEDVHARFPRLQKGEHLAIRREIVTAADRILEKIAERNLRRHGSIVGLAGSRRNHGRCSRLRISGGCLGQDGDGDKGSGDECENEFHNVVSEMQRGPRLDSTIARRCVQGSSPNTTFHSLAKQIRLPARDELENFRPARHATQTRRSFRGGLCH